MYFRRPRKLLESWHDSRNLINGTHTLAVLFGTYAGPFLNGTKLEQMDSRIRKLIKRHNAFHPRVSIDRLYVSRKERGRGLATIEDSVDESIQKLEGDINKRIEKLITEANDSNGPIRKNRKKKQETRNWKKNNYMVISSDKLTWLYTKPWTRRRKGSLLRVAWSGFYGISTVVDYLMPNPLAQSVGVVKYTD